MMVFILVLAGIGSNMSKPTGCKPTKDKAGLLEIKESLTGIIVGFSDEELELLTYMCPKGKSFPSYIKSLVMKEIGE